MIANIGDLPSPEAVLFDLDGTLVDTVATRIAAWIEALSDAGFPDDSRPAGPTHRPGREAARS